MEGAMEINFRLHPSRFASWSLAMEGTGCMYMFQFA